MPEYAPVVLRSEIQINGKTICAQSFHARSAWLHAQADPAHMERVRAQHATALGHAVMRALDPTITIQLPTELDEAVMKRTMGESPTTETE